MRVAPGFISLSRTIKVVGRYCSRVRYFSLLRGGGVLLNSPINANDGVRRGALFNSRPDRGRYTKLCLIFYVCKCSIRWAGVWRFDLRIGAPSGLAARGRTRSRRGRHPPARGAVWRGQGRRRGAGRARGDRRDFSKGLFEGTLRRDFRRDIYEGVKLAGRFLTLEGEGTWFGLRVHSQLRRQQQVQA